MDKICNPRKFGDEIFKFCIESKLFGKENNAIVGRSNIVGIRLGLLLLDVNAIITSCHF